MQRHLDSSPPVKIINCPNTGAQEAECIRVFHGHGTGRLLFCIIDEHLWSGSADSTLRKWNLASGEELNVYRGHTAGITCMSYLDGMVYTGSRDCSIRVWSVESGGCTHIFGGHVDGHVEAVNCLYVGVDGIFSGGRDREILEWNVGTRRVRRKYSGHNGVVTCLIATPDELYSSSEDCTIRVWFKNGPQKRIIEAVSRVIHLRLVDNSLYASFSGTRNCTSLGKWNLPLESVPEIIFRTKYKSTRFFQILPDKDEMYCCNPDYTVSTHSLTDGTCQWVFRGHTKAVTQCQFFDDLVYTSSDDGTLRSWRLKERERPKDYIALYEKAMTGEVTKLADVHALLKGLVETKEYTRVLELFKFLYPPAVALDDDSDGEIDDEGERVSTPSTKEGPRRKKKDSKGMVATVTSPEGGEEEVGDLSTSKKRKSNSEGRQALITPRSDTYVYVMEAAVRQNNLELALRVSAMVENEGLTPPSQLFDMLIEAYGQQKMLDHAAFVLSVMERAGVQATIATFNTLISVCTRVNEMERAMSAVQEMERCRVQADMETYRLLIDGFGAQSMLDKAMDSFAHMKRSLVWPNATVYGAIMEVCFKCGNADQAEKLYAEMQKNNITPTRNTFATLIAGYGLVGNFDRALAIFHEMKSQKGLEPDKSIYCAVIEAAVSCDSIDIAKSYLREMLHLKLQPDIKTFEVLIGGWEKVKSLKEAFLTLTEMRTLGLTPKESTYCRLVECAITCQNPDVGLTVFKEMVGAGVKPPVAVVNMLVKQFGEQDKMDMCMVVIAILRSRNLEVHRSTLEIAIGDLVTAGNLESALELLDFLIAQAQSPSVGTLNLLMAGLRIAGKTQAAVELYNRMEEWAMEPDRSCLQELLQVYLCTGNCDGIIRTIDTLYPVSGVPFEERDADFNVSLRDDMSEAVSALCKLEKHELAWKMISERSKNRLNNAAALPLIRLTPPAYIALIQSYAGANQWQQVDQVVSSMADAGACSVQVFNAVLQSYLDAPQLNDSIRRAESLKSQMLANQISPDPQTVDLMIRIAVKDGKRTKGRNILHQEGASVNLPPSSYASLMRACNAQNEPSQAMDLWRAFLERDSPPDAEIIAEYIHALVLVENMEDAFSSLRLYLDFNCIAPLWILNTLIGKYATMALPRMAFRVFDWLRRFEIDADETTYRLLIKCSLNGGELDSAQRVFVEMAVFRIEPSLETLNMMIAGFGRHRRLQSAFNLFHSLQDKYGLEPDGDSYASLLIACLSSSQLSKLWSVYGEMKKLGYTAEYEVYARMATAYGQSGNMERALAIVEDSLSTHKKLLPEPVCNDILSHCLSQPRMLKKALYLIDVMLSPSHDVGVREPTALQCIQVCCENEETDNALRMYEYLVKTKNHYPDLDTYLQMIHVISLDQSVVEKGWELIDDMRRILRPATRGRESRDEDTLDNVYVVCATIELLTGQDQFPQASTYLRQHKAKAVQLARREAERMEIEARFRALQGGTLPELRPATSASHTHRRPASRENGGADLERPNSRSSSRAGSRPGSRASNTRPASRSGAAKRESKATAPGLRRRESMMQMFAGISVGEGEKKTTAPGMVGFGLDFSGIGDEEETEGDDIRIYDTFLQCAVRAKQTDECLKTFELIRKKSLQPTATTYAAVIDCFAVVKCFDDTEKMWAELLRYGPAPNEAAYTAIIHARVAEGRLRAALDIYSEMRNLRIRGTTETFNHIVRGFTDIDCMKESMGVLETMIEEGVKPNRETYKVLLYGAVQREGRSMGTRVLQSMLDMAEVVPKLASERIKICNEIFIELRKGHHTVKTFWLYEMMKAASVTPDATSFQHLLLAAAVRADLTLALPLIEECVQRQLPVSGDPFHQLLRVASKQTRPDHATTMLQAMRSLRIPGNPTTRTVVEELLHRIPFGEVRTRLASAIKDAF